MTAISDLALPLPSVACWNVAGFDFGWHVRQLRDKGHRFRPALFLPPLDGVPANADNPNIVAKYIEPFADDLRWCAANGVAVDLRMNNISDCFTRSPRYRGLPMDQSPLVFQPAGETMVADCMADPEIWRREGEALRNSAYLRRLAELLPPELWGDLIDNNEGRERTYDSARTYSTWNELLPLDQIRRKSVRMAKLIEEEGITTPAKLEESIYWKRRSQYNAFAFGVHDGNPRLVGRGGSPKSVGYRHRGGLQVASMRDYLPHDVPSPTYYLTASDERNFTDLWPAEVLNMLPAWGDDPVREISLTINNENGVIAGDGTHPPMTPERFRGYVRWLFWSLRDKGKAVRIRWFESSATKPEQVVYESHTVGDYIEVVMQVADEICTNPILREFWLNGETVLVPESIMPTDAQLVKLGYSPFPPDLPDTRKRILECTANGGNWHSYRWDGAKNRVVGDPVRVWSVAVAHGGRWLVVAFAPEDSVRNADWLTIGIPGGGELVFPWPRAGGDYIVAEPSGIIGTRLEV